MLVTTRALAKRNSRRNTRTSEGDLDSLDSITDLAEEDTNEGETNTDSVGSVEGNVRSCLQWYYWPGIFLMLLTCEVYQRSNLKCPPNFLKRTKSGKGAG